MSDIARLRQSIASEYWAMHEGLSGLAITARHAFIREKQHRLSLYHSLLSQVVGAEEASKTLVTISDAMLEAYHAVQKRETRP